MTGPALERLMTVQDLDTVITQLQHRRAALAERSGLAAVEAELADVTAQQAVADGRRAELAQAQKQLEEQIAAVTDRRSSVEQRMYAARGSSARDLQAMDDEVRHLAQRLSELEEQELVVMVDLDPVDAELAQLAARRAPVEEKAVALRAEVAHEQTEIDTELSSATSNRVTEAALLPAPLAERYESLRTRMKGIGAARLIGNHCGGCHLVLSSVEVERIRSQPEDTVTTCEQCGRILVPD